MNKKSQHKPCISFIKELEPLNYLISLFSILREEADDKDWIQEGNTIKWIPKDPNNINVDYEDLRIKILNWMSDRKNSAPLDLNQQESDILRQCSHAAYFFVTEDDYPKEKQNKGFIRFHEYYFR